MDECSALRIQCAWRRFQARRLLRELEAHRRTLDRNSHELAVLRRENAAMKIQSLRWVARLRRRSRRPDAATARHYRSQRMLAREAGKFAEDARSAAEEAMRLQRESDRAKAQAEQLDGEREFVLRQKAQVEQLLSVRCGRCCLRGLTAGRARR